MQMKLEYSKVFVPSTAISSKQKTFIPEFRYRSLCVWMSAGFYFEAYRRKHIARVE